MCRKGLRVVPGAWVGAAALIVLVLGLSEPADAVTIGPAFLPMSSETRLCLVAQPCMFAATDPPSGVPYPSVSPIDGVVVRWRARFIGSGTNTARFRVLSTGSTPGNYIARGSGATETVGPGVQAFGTRVQILTGDLIGLDLGAAQTLGLGSRTAAGASIQRAEPPPFDAGGFTFDAPFINRELILSADVEADADDDGYGDVTQDQCPSDPGPEACDATLTIGAPDLTVPSSTAGDCFSSDTCSLWTATTPLGDERQRWASPIDGVIVRWRVRLINFALAPAFPTLGPYRLRTLRKASDTEFTAIGSSAFETVPHDPSKQTEIIQAFATRIPVLAGDRLGLDMPPKRTPPPGGLHFDQRAGSHQLEVPAPPGGGTYALGGFVTGSPLYNADVEPDADHDGFGDVTQDACPADATTQGTCPVAIPPDLIGPALGISHRRVRLTRRGVARVRLRCPAGEPAGCLAGRLRLTSAKRVQVAVRRIVRLGSKRFSIPAGRSKVVRIRLSRRNRALVRRRGRLRVRARASAVDQAGNRGRSTTTFLLLPPRR